MSYQLKKLRKTVEIQVEGHESMKGDVFLNKVVFNHEGPERVLDLLESGGPFLPFCPKKGETLIVKKSAIQKVVVDRNFELELVQMYGNDAYIEREVSIMLRNGDTETGTLFIEPRVGASRVQDEVNRKGGFIRLIKGKKVHIFGTFFIAMVKEGKK